jgi:hypothetical protein
MNDLRVMRERQLAAADALDRAAAATATGSAALCVTTTTVTTYPTSAGKFYACNPNLCYGNESEGATPTFSADGSTIIYALNLGTSIPPTGTVLVVHAVGGRWCFRFDG